MLPTGPGTGNKVFSVVIFFISFREAMEAALVIGTLLGMLETLAQDIIPEGSKHAHGKLAPVDSGRGKDPDDMKKGAVASPDSETPSEAAAVTPASEDPSAAQLASERTLLVKKLRRTIFAGSFTGLAIAFAIGAIFLAVFYTQANDLYAKAEEAWEGAFNLVAMCLITPMALAILRADRSRAKWRRKLKASFEEKFTGATQGDQALVPTLDGNAARPSLLARIRAKIAEPFHKANRGKTAIFTLPMITTLREGLEGVVFIGGVSLGLPATSIPLAAVVGIACGFAIGAIIFKAGGFARVRYFLIFSTCILLIIAAGMATRSVYYLQFYKYVQKVGDGAAESGSGPGSYDALNYIWHIDCCNPEDQHGGTGWGILNSLTGFNNTGTYGSIFAYVAYWFVVIGYMLYSLWREGRLALGYRWGGKTVRLWESKKAVERRERRAAREARRAERAQEAEQPQSLPAQTQMATPDGNDDKADAPESSASRSHYSDEEHSAQEKRSHGHVDAEATAKHVEAQA